MKIMNVSLSIDVRYIDQVEALEVFMRKLGGHPSNNPVATLAELEEAKAETKEEKAPAKRASRAKPVPNPEPEKVEEVEEEENFLDEEEENFLDDEVKIDHVLLRSMVAERQGTHRPALKAKFEEMGVANVSSIPENKLKSFHTFLLTLTV